MRPGRRHVQEGPSDLSLDELRNPTTGKPGVHLRLLDADGEVDLGFSGVGHGRVQLADETIVDEVAKLISGAAPKPVNANARTTDLLG